MTLKSTTLTRIFAALALALVGVLAFSVVRAQDPAEFIRLSVEVREPEASLIEFRLHEERLEQASGRLAPRVHEPHQRFVRVHSGWLHYWLYSSLVQLRPGLRARIAARLVDRPYLSASLTASLEGSVGFTLFGTGVKVAGGVGVATPALTWERTGRLITTGIQLSYDGATWTEVIPLGREYYYDATQPCLTDFPGLDKLPTLMQDAGFEVVPDDFCLGHGLQPSRWMRTAHVRIPSALRMFSEAGQLDIVPISAGYQHTCAISSDRSIQCWGSNSHGQLFAPLANNFSQVDVGRFHVCALDADGAITCWGDNEYGQTDPPTDAQFTQIDVGQHHTCALTTDDTIRCWGRNTYGQIDAPEGTFRQVSAGWYHTCALAADGAIQCWGNNDYGEATPPQFAQYRQVSAGFGHTCAIAADASVDCWGDNSQGQATPPPGTQFTWVVTGHETTCGLDVAGAISCWEPTAGAVAV